MAAGGVRDRQARILDTLARLGPASARPLRDVLDGPTCWRFKEGMRIIVATDLGLRDVARRSTPTVAERFVVLKTAAFAQDPHLDALGPLPVRPWAWVDDSQHVSQLVRFGWKEVALER